MDHEIIQTILDSCRYVCPASSSHKLIDLLSYLIIFTPTFLTNWSQQQHFTAQKKDHSTGMYSMSSCKPCNCSHPIHYTRVQPPPFQTHMFMKTHTHKNRSQTYTLRLQQCPTLKAPQYKMSEMMRPWSYTKDAPQLLWISLQSANPHSW